MSLNTTVLQNESRVVFESCEVRRDIPASKGGQGTKGMVSQIMNAKHPIFSRVFDGGRERVESSLRNNK